MACGRGEIGRRSRLKICLPFGNAGSIPAVRTIFAACLLSLLLINCGPLTTASRDPKVLVRVAEDEAKGLDPQLISDLASLRIAADQFEGLTRFSADGKAEAGLASDWQISGDGLQWTFRLKPGITFSDGQPITASTFEDVFNRLLAPATASPVRELFEAIASIKAVTPRDVVIRLRHPFPSLDELMAHPAVAALPLHRKGWAADRPVVSSGAYQLTRWALSDHIRLEANPRWHGGKPAIAIVEWRPVTDTLAALRLYQAGAADILGEVPSARLPQIKVAYPKQLHVAPYRGSYYFAFNTRKPPFSDPRVRIALSLAVEREWIASKLIATGISPAWGIVPPGTTGLSPYHPRWSDWPRGKRLAVARHLLATAGYGVARPLSFDIRFNSDIDHRRISVALAAFWKPLGVEARLLNSEASLHFASLRRADFELARSGWIGDLSVPENFLSVHKGNGGAINYSGFTDADYDAALDRALLIADPQRRAIAMRAAEVLLIDQSPILPLYFYVSKSLVGSRVGGWRDNVANMHPSRTLRIITQ